MSTPREDLERLEDRDSQDLTKIHNIQREDSSNLRINAHRDDFPIQPSSNQSSSSKQPVSAPRRSARFLKAVESSVSGGGCSSSTAALKARGTESLSKPKPRLKARTAAPKARKIKPSPKIQATPNSKHEAEVRATKSSRSVPRKPQPDVPIDEFANERNVLDVQFRRLLDMAGYFQDRLTVLHNNLPNVAAPEVKPSGFMSRENVIKEFKAGVEELVEARFPEMVQEVQGLKQAMTSFLEKSRSDPDNSIGDGHQKNVSGTGRRKSAKNTSSVSLIHKKRLKEDENDGAEDAGLHHPHQKLIPLDPQDTLGHGEASTSTSGKRQRATDSDDSIDYRHPKRRRKVLKGKGNEIVMVNDSHGETYPSNGLRLQEQLEVGRHVLDVLDTETMQRATDSDNSIDYRHPKRLRKVSKWKGIETVIADNNHGETYPSNDLQQQEQLGRHILNTEAIQSVGSQSEPTVSASMP